MLKAFVVVVFFIYIFILCYIREIAESRQGYRPPLSAEGSLMEQESVVIDESDACVLINYNDLCNDIYVRDW